VATSTVVAIGVEASWTTVGNDVGAGVAAVTIGDASGLGCTTTGVGVSAEAIDVGGGATATRIARSAAPGKTNLRVMASIQRRDFEASSHPKDSVPAIGQIVNFAHVETHYRYDV
jgi:hypothetical protein